MSQRTMSGRVSLTFLAATPPTSPGQASRTTSPRSRALRRRATGRSSERDPATANRHGWHVLRRPWGVDRLKGAGFGRHELQRAARSHSAEASLGRTVERGYHVVRPGHRRPGCAPPRRRRKSSGRDWRRIGPGGIPSARSGRCRRRSEICTLRASLFEPARFAASAGPLGLVGRNGHVARLNSVWERHVRRRPGTRVTSGVPCWRRSVCHARITDVADHPEELIDPTGLPHECHAGRR